MLHENHNILFESKHKGTISEGFCKFFGDRILIIRKKAHFLNLESTKGTISEYQYLSHRDRLSKVIFSSFLVVFSLKYYRVHCAKNIQWPLLIKYARLDGHSQFVNDPLLIIVIEIVQSAVHNQIPPMHTRFAFNPFVSLSGLTIGARGHRKTSRVEGNQLGHN